MAALTAALLILFAGERKGRLESYGRGYAHLAVLTPFRWGHASKPHSTALSGGSPEEGRESSSQIARPLEAL